MSLKNPSINIEVHRHSLLEPKKKTSHLHRNIKWHNTCRVIAIDNYKGRSKILASIWKFTGIHYWNQRRKLLIFTGISISASFLQNCSNSRKSFVRRFWFDGDRDSYGRFLLFFVLHFLWISLNPINQSKCNAKNIITSTYEISSTHICFYRLRDLNLLYFTYYKNFKKPYLRFSTECGMQSMNEEKHIVTSNKWIFSRILNSVSWLATTIAIIHVAKVVAQSWNGKWRVLMYI